jgi:CheY-like chemotaxis protein
MAKVDPAQIEQVLMNLAANARDAMPDGGKLIIETANVTLDEEYVQRHPEATSAGQYVVLIVSDTGVGMASEVRARVFEPFFTTKSAGRGTGLRLSTCYGIVSQLGGHIEVDGEPGRGTTFRTYLPRVYQPASTLTYDDEPEYLPVGDETVLLVEDEPLVRQYAAGALRRQGYTVLEAGNGHEALSVTQGRQGEKIHLLLTDVVMPLMSGKELAVLIKEVQPGTKVLYTSGYTDAEMVRQGALGEGAEFMQKPFTPAMLANRVREVLEQ